MIVVASTKVPTDGSLSRPINKWVPLTAAL